MAVYKISANGKEGRIDSAAFEKEYDILLKKYPDLKVRVVKGDQPGYIPASNYHKALEAGFKPYVEPDKPEASVQPAAQDTPSQIQPVAPKQQPIDLSAPAQAPAMIKTDPNLPASPEQQLEAEMTKQGEELLQQDEEARQALKEQARKAASNTEERNQQAKQQLKSVSQDIIETNQFAYTPIGGSPMQSKVAVASPEQQQAYREAEQESIITDAAKRKAEAAQSVITEIERENKNFFIAAGRGIGQTVSDIDNWDMGATDYRVNKVIQNTADKFAQDPESLTEAEKDLLEATALEIAVSGEFGDELTRGYKAGQVTGEALPFMAEILINPLSGTGRAATAWAIKKFGKEGFSALVKRYGTRVAADVAGAAGIAATTGAGGVAADTQARMTGQAQFQVDNNGYVVYTGHAGGEELPSALAKAYGARTIEYFSEMSGEYFAKLSPLTRKITPKRVANMLDNIKTSDWAKVVDDFATKTQWQGTINEWAEEQVGTALNAMFIGDQEISDLWDLDQQIDTFLGVSLMGGAFSIAKTAGYRTPKYRAEKELKKAGEAGKEAFGDQNWEDIQAEIDNASDEQLHAIVKQAVNAAKQAKTPQQQDENSPINLDDPINNQDRDNQIAAGMIIANYVAKLQQQRGANLADMKRKTEGEVTPEQLQLENSFYEGVNRRMSVRKAKKELEEAAKEIDPAIDEVIQDPAFIASIPEREDAEQVLRYANAKAKYDGLTQAYADDIEDQVQSAKEQIQSRTDKAGNLTLVETITGEQVHILSENVAFDAEGFVDKEHSEDKPVIVVDQEGNKKMLSIREISKLLDQTNADEATNAIAEDIRNTVTAKAEQEAETPEPDEIQQAIEGVNVQDVVQLNLNNKPTTATIQSIDPATGEILLQLDEPILNQEGKEQKVISLPADQFTKALIRNDKPGDEPPAAPPAAAGQLIQTESTGQPTMEPETQAPAPVKEFPKDKEGYIDYSQITEPQDFLDALMTEFSPEDAAAVVEDYVAEAEKAIKAAEKEKDPVKKRRKVAAERANAEKYIQMRELLEKSREIEQTPEALEEQAADEQEVTLSNTTEEAIKALSETEPQEEIISSTKNNETEEDVPTNNQPIEQAEQAGKEEDSPGISEDKERLNRMLAEGLGSIESTSEQGATIKVITGEGRFDTNTGVKSPYAIYEYTRFNDGTEYFSPYGGFITLDDARAMLEHKDGPLPVTSYHGQKYDGIAESTFKIAVKKGVLDKSYDWEWIEYPRVKGKGYAVGRLKPLESKDQSEASQQEQESTAQDPVKSEIPANDDIMAEDEIVPAKVSKPKLPKTKEDHLNVLRDVTANDEMRPTLNAVYFDAEGKNIVATDAHRLIIIPYKSIKKTELLNARIKRGKIGGAVEGKFPNYKAVIPDHRKKINVKLNLETLLGQAITLDKEANERIKTLDKPSKNEKNAERGVFINGVLVTTNNLAPVLRALYDTGTKEVEIYYEDPSRAMVIKDVENEGKIALVMPVYNDAEQNERPSGIKTPVLINKPYSVDIKKLKSLINSLENSKPEFFDVHTEGLNRAKKENNKFSIAYYQERLDRYRIAREEKIQALKDELAQSEKGQPEAESKKSDPIDILAEAEKAAKKAEIKKEEEAVNTDPSPEQKEAGNYKKGHIQVQGLDITIENPKGSERTGTDQNGKKWSVTINNTYGYFKRTKGKDGDQVDVFIGENPLSETVFVVDQINPQTGEFDESKVMLGFDSAEQAQQSYMANYSPGWKGFGSITQVPIDKFKTWLNDGARQIKAFAEYREFQKSELQPENAATESQKKSTSEENKNGKFPENESDNVDIQSNDQNEEGQKLTKKETEAENKESEVVKKENKDDNLQPDVSLISDEDLNKEVQGLEDIIKEREEYILNSNTPLTGSNSGIGTLTESELDRFTALTAEQQRRNPSNISAEEAKKRVEEKRKARLEEKDKAKEDPKKDTNKQDKPVLPQRGDKIKFTLGGREITLPFDEFNAHPDGKLVFDYFGLKMLLPGQYEIISPEKKDPDINKEDEASLIESNQDDALPKLDDFGEKIGGARKDMDIKRNTRDTDSQPAWRRKYRFANADGSITIGAKVDTSKPFTVAYEKKGSFGRSHTYFITKIGTAEPMIFNSEAEAEAYIPIFEVYAQKYRVDKNGDQFVIGKRASTGKIMEFNSFPTKEEALTYLFSTEGATSLLNRKRENFSIPALDKVERTGKDHRKGRNIDTDEFMNTFGFRGGEFGEWVKPLERQTMLNAAYDSFMDLADMLGVPPRALSLAGNLSIAFGARGTGGFEGGARAHFESGRAVINLTRMKGAGSLAHEWAHAVDNYFAIQKANLNYDRNEKGEVKAGNIMLSRDNVLRSGMRPELYRLFRDISNALKSKQVTQVKSIEEKQKLFDNALKPAKREADALINKFTEGIKTYKYNRKEKKYDTVTVKATSEQVDEAKRLIDLMLSAKGDPVIWKGATDTYQGAEIEALNVLHKKVFGKSGLKRNTSGFYNLGYYASRLYRAAEDLEKAKNGESEKLSIDTEFYKNSKEFDKTRATPYFAQTHEMFARAFEYFIQTKLDERKDKSDYLQYDKAPVYEAIYGISPYPSGEERVELNKLFQAFFDELKTKEDENKNVIMFRKSDRKTDAAGFYSTVEAALEAIPQDKGTPGQMKAMLLKNGAKQAELDGMGWDDQFPDATKKVSKERQLDIIQSTNPMRDDIHVGIRALEDIKTFDQVVDDPESFVYGDFSKEDAQKAIKEGSVTVYSSTPIKNGAFVSTSEKQAKDYAGNGKVYSQKVSLGDVAWINGDEGQLAKADNTITKAEIQSWIDQNRIEVEEVEKGRPIDLENAISERKQYENQMKRKYGDSQYLSKMKSSEWDKWNELQSLVDNANKGDYTDTKYSKYQEPGGKNYKELLLTMPYTASINRKDISNRVEKINTELSALSGKGHSAEIFYELLSERDRLINELNGFKSSHFDEPNILAHVRFNERTMPNGEKVLFVEEIQSDWAQKGKKEGFKGEDSEYNSVYAELVKIRDEKEAYRKEIDPYSEYSIPNLKDEYPRMKELDEKENQLIDREYELRRKRDSVPDMPFKQTGQWVNLALRRMMRYAAENGFDRIAWTNGEQQADRYDLSKQVDDIWTSVYSDSWTGKQYEKLKDVEVTLNNGEVKKLTVNESGKVVSGDFEGESLDNVVGKEMAEKIIGAQEDTNFGEQDLKVGGEGMKAFYDKIVPSAASKLGKPFGAKVEQIELPAEADVAYDKSHDRLELSYEAQEIQDRYIDSMQDEESDYTLEQYVADMKDAGYEVLFDENGEPENLKKITKGQTFTVQSIPVTDKMYESVIQGVPLYKMTEELRQRIGVVEQAKLAVLRSFFDNVSKEAVNAVDIVVVDSRDELSQELQNKMPDDLDVQGFYYTGDNKAYFILNEIQRPELAFRTWVHEVGVHAGLRSIIPARDFSRLMRKIYNDLGQDEIRRVVPKAYWADTTEEQAEEYLAFIGEKIIKQEDLTKKEQSIWNKIVDLFHEVLNKLYKNGRFTKQDAESLVMASVQNSFRGSNGKLASNMLSGQSGQTGVLQRNDRTPATTDSGTGEGTIFAAAREALKKYERNKETAAQLQINWEAESGNVPARRDKAIASSAATSVLQRKAGYDPDISTGVSYVERLITNRGHVTFMGDMLTGPARIKSAGDIAFIFKNLESAATENTFFVFMNDKGEYRVLYVGTGSSSGAVVDVSQIAPAAKEFGATGVCMVHNHPSGNLNPSSADVGLHRRISAISDKLGVTVMPSIIINTDSGEYAEFDQDYPMKAERPTEIKAKPVDVYQFDRQKLYKATKERKKITRSRDVAEFLSQQKRGAVDKLHLIIADRQNVISRYLLVDGKIKTDDLISLILEEAGRHGEAVFIATNGRLDDAKYIRESVKAADINLLDVLEIKQNDDIVNNYRSLADQQVLEPEGVYGSDKALFRKSDTEEAPETQKAQDVYEQALEKTTINIIGHKWTDINREYLFKEGYQDSMLSLKIAQEAIAKETDSPIQDFEDAYTAENHLSSKGAAETEFYNKNYLTPMFAAVKAITDKGAEYEDVKAYVMAKHGLERNRLFAWRDALKSLQGVMEPDAIEKIIAEHDERVAHFKEAQRQGGLSRQEVIDKTERLREGLVNGYKMFRKDDYSGLTDLTDSKKDFEEKAEAMVEAFEKKYPEETADLWDSINAATKRTLQKQFEGGLLTREMYEYIRGMFEYFVPLRGFDEDTACDMYEYYFTNESSFNAPIKKAEGRKSLAEDPFANIGNMAQSGILQANRNLMKQKLLNLALNHPTSLLTVREVWYKNEGTTEKPKWVKSFPEFPENATPEQAQQAIQEHDKLMRELEAKEMAQHKRTKVKLDYKASKRQISEHIVMVKSAGKEYAIYVNGNPRMAQAVNGLTNPDTGKIYSAIGQLNRQLAANFTTRNPAFVFSNMSRDIIFASTAVGIKEDAAYRKQFRGTLGEVMLKIGSLMKKYKEGTLDMNIPLEKAFSDFMSNGGETGYTALYNLDKYKSMMQKHIRKAKGVTLNPIDAGQAIVDGIGFMNRCAEDISRFAVYYTSRKQGRSVQRSIKDAKEITVNFNKKGSGVMGARHLRTYYLFFNAAVQSLDNFSKLAKKDPKRFSVAIGSYIAAGVAVPVITSFLLSLFGDDDDKEAYNNLPNWIRRNNLCIYSGNGKFVTIPLPIEMRAFYGLGELFTQWAAGHMKYDNVGLEMANQILDLLPLNPIGAEGDIAGSVFPDFVKPFAQVWRNKDFFGKPIYKKNDFNELMPAFTKAYSGTNKQLVKSAELLNEAFGGDKYTKKMDVNPAAVEHIFEGYFGGMGKTINQLGKTIGMAWNKDDRQWRNIPVLNRFFSDTKDSKSAFNEINKAYYYYMDEFKETAQRLRGYKKEANLDIMDYAEKLDKLYNSPAYERYELWYGRTDYNGRKIEPGYKDDIAELQDELKMAETPEERKSIELDLYQIKAELIEELEAAEKKKAK